MRVLRRGERIAVAAGVAALVLPGRAIAQEADAAALARQLSNPIASLVSVPFQQNWEQGVGPGEDQRFILNFQPVMPFALNPRTNLIARVIVPYVSQPSLGGGTEPASGLGDMVFSLFFSPAAPGKWIWGVGPVFSLPVPAEPTLGSGKWGFGPTAVFLKQTGSWTMGALLNHVWSFAGDADRSSVNQTFLQPFLAYGTPSGVTFTLQSESTANWEAEGGEEWTVPLNVLITKVVKLGQRPMQVGGGAGYYVASPTGGPEWKIRTVVVLLFPR